MERRKVTMVSLTAGPNGQTIRAEAVDYVDVADLEDYVEDARTRWQSVEVGDEPDHGPAGAKGAYKLHPEVAARKAARLAARPEGK